MEKQLLELIEKVNYLYEQEKAREDRRAAKISTEGTPSKDVEEVFGFYRLFVKSDARISPQSKDAIRSFIKEFGKEILIATTEKKGKSKWFQENCSWRGASWFFSNKVRFNRWIEEGVPTEKKRPYWKGMVMTQDTKKVLVDGEFKEFAGDPKQIEWRIV